MSVTVEFKKHYVYVTQEVPQHPNAITKVAWSFNFVDGVRISTGIGFTEFDIPDIVSRSAYDELLLADSATDADIEQAVKDQLDWVSYAAFHENQLSGRISPDETMYFGDNTFNMLEPSKVSSVTMRQARLALAQQGLLQTVEDAIALIPEPDRSAVSIEWEYSAFVKRESSWIGVLAPALGMNDEQMDDLFALAATL
jgi:hypothetical protein